MRVDKLKSFLFISLFLHLLIIFFFFFYSRSSKDTFKKPLIREQEELLILTTLVPFQSPFPQASPIIPQSPILSDQQEDIQQQIKEPTKVDSEPIEKSIEESCISEMPMKIMANNRLEKLMDKEFLAKQEKAQKQPQQPQKKSIFAMTRALLRSIREQGNSLIEKKGKCDFPSLEELKYLSYQRKVNEALMNAWNIVRPPRASISRNNRSASDASVNFEINKDGSLAFVQLIASSGNRDFDDLVLKAIKKAAPFPPIPDHLGIIRYRPRGGKYYVSW